MTTRTKGVTNKLNDGKISRTGHGESDETKYRSKDGSATTIRKDGTIKDTGPSDRITSVRTGDAG